MAERKKTTKPDAKRDKEAKREAEGKTRKGASKAPQKAQSTAGASAKARAKPAQKESQPAKRKARTKTKREPKTAPKPKAAPTPEAPPRPVVKARARFVRVAPRKARLVADQVRGLGIDDARSLLRFSQRDAARDLIKLIDSAAANAENNHDLVADDLRVDQIHVDEGPTIRRYRARALGRATRIDKRTSHISVALVPEE
jgi:large subunit ribosomal protein L22